MMSKSRWLAAAVALLVMMAMSGPVAAQQEESDADDLELPGTAVLGDTLWSSSTTSTSTTMVLALGYFSVQLATGTNEEQVQRYLRQNAVAVQHDLYLGAGETTRDLAELFGVHREEYDAFARLLYDRRKVLAPLVEPGTVDSASARKFVEIITEAIWSVA